MGALLSPLAVDERQEIHLEPSSNATTINYDVLVIYHASHSYIARDRTSLHLPRFSPVVRDVEVHAMGGVLAKGGEKGAIFFGDKGGAECQRRYLLCYARWPGKLSWLPGASSIVGDVQSCLEIRAGARCEVFRCKPARLLSDGREFSDRGERERVCLLPGIASVTGRVEQAFWLCEGGRQRL